MARKSTKITKPVKVEEEPQSNGSLFDYLRFGESYTSLILGIIVVIISTVLLLSFVNNKNAAKQDTPQLLSQKDIALPSTPLTTNTPSADKVDTTTTPVPTRTPTITKAAATPTVAPTKKVEPTKTVAKASPTPIRSGPTIAPVKVAQGSVNPASGEYTVAANDNLWIIAEKQYKSGYNWVDIARANKLSNPDMITKGQKLKMPKVEQKIATVGTQPSKAVAQKQPAVQPNSAKITGNTYTTVKGDNLWNIAVRAYGDGFQWQKIASANNLSNPRIIHSGNTIKIPRG